MQLHDVDGVIVGADRVVSNGDTANKVSDRVRAREGGWMDDKSCSMDLG
jgi:hypothetical protein